MIQKLNNDLHNINDWNSTLPQAINNAKTFTPEHLYNWKRQEKEILKGYIRDWNHVHTLIEHELKLDELNKNVQRLKVSFDSINKTVNELGERIINLEFKNQSNLNCENTLTIVSGIASVIPKINIIGSAVATITAGACAIAGV